MSGELVRLDRQAAVLDVFQRRLDAAVERDPKVVTTAGYAETAEFEWEHTVDEWEREHGREAEGCESRRGGELPAGR